MKVCCVWKAGLARSGLGHPYPSPCCHSLPPTGESAVNTSATAVRTEVQSKWGILTPTLLLHLTPTPKIKTLILFSIHHKKEEQGQSTLQVLPQAWKNKCFFFFFLPDLASLTIYKPWLAGRCFLHFLTDRMKWSTKVLRSDNSYLRAKLKKMCTRSS